MRVDLAPLILPLSIGLIWGVKAAGICLLVQFVIGLIVSIFN